MKRFPCECMTLSFAAAVLFGLISFTISSQVFSESVKMEAGTLTGEWGTFKADGPILVGKEGMRVFVKENAHNHSHEENIGSLSTRDIPDGRTEVTIKVARKKVPTTSDGKRILDIEKFKNLVSMLTGEANSLTKWISAEMIGEDTSLIERYNATVSGIMRAMSTARRLGESTLEKVLKDSLNKLNEAQSESFTKAVAEYAKRMRNSRVAEETEISGQIKTPEDFERLFGKSAGRVVFVVKGNEEDRGLIKSISGNGPQKEEKHSGSRSVEEPS